MIRFIFAVFICHCLLLIPAKCEPLQLYTNHFVAEINGGKGEAIDLARKFNLRLMPTEVYPNFYHFMDQRQPHLNRNPAWRVTRSLKGHGKVQYVEQQVFLHRELRKFEHGHVKSRKHSLSSKMDFNDPFYPKLWYLHGRGFTTLEKNKTVTNLNVEPVWKQGLSGRGVTLFVLDDGLQMKNKEIAPNYERVDSWDASDMKRPLPSPAPRGPTDNHGTFCAAAMAAAANNSVCGVGVAYHAKVGGIRVLGKKALTDLQESLALSLWLDVADVASTSWGPRDDGKTVQGPKKLTKAALKRATSEGRDGSGAILVWAAGNGGMNGDNANLDGYAGSIHTITIGALSHDGNSCAYSESGSSVLASVAVSGFALGMYGVSVVVPNLDGTCKHNFQGTSAAAPLVGGVIALLLEANPNLTWRDVQHLIAITSQRTGNYDQWRKNGAGLEYSLKNGFGAIDAQLLINAGKLWKNLPRQKQEMHSFLHASQRTVSLVPKKNTSLTLEVLNSKISNLEHVIASLSITNDVRGLLQIYLTSPSGTESQLLTTRPNDNSTMGFSSWPFMSVHFWGERPKGTWKLTVTNGDEHKGNLQQATLVLYGH